MSPAIDDPYDLGRFVVAQGRLLDRVVAELRVGRKTSHWMWFVFPQVAGLGSSPMSVRFAIGSLAEARAYLDHPVLGLRLLDCIRLVLAVEGGSAHAVFGSPDDAKFRSCLTLFARAATQEPLFAAALDRFYGGEPDPETLARLA